MSALRFKVAVVVDGRQHAPVPGVGAVADGDAAEPLKREEVVGPKSPPGATATIHLDTDGPGGAMVVVILGVRLRHRP